MEKPQQIRIDILLEPENPIKHFSIEASLVLDCAGHPRPHFYRQSGHLNLHLNQQKVEDEARAQVCLPGC
jgi:hypothetical protein